MPCIEPVRRAGKIAEPYLLALQQAQEYADQARRAADMVQPFIPMLQTMSQYPPTPRGSIEGSYCHTCQMGHRHPFALTGLAVLDVTPPGVGGLNNLDECRVTRPLHHGAAGTRGGAP